MKINLAFAVVRQMKGEHKTESAGESSGQYIVYSKPYCVVFMQCLFGNLHLNI